MNKFKQLQLAGTLIVLTPVILVAGAIVSYNLPEPQKVEEAAAAAAPQAPKVDTVIVVKEVEKVAPPAPVVKKSVPAPAPTPPVIKDTVKKVTVELDTIK